MAKSQNNQNPKHLKGFWPIFGVCVVALVAAGIIYAFAYGNILQDEVNSASFWSRLSLHKAVQKAPVNANTKTVPTK